MADLKEIAEVCYDQIYPNASVETSVKVDHFLVEAKNRYALEMYIMSKNIAREEGGFEIPSSLWREANIDIKNNEADISELKIFKSLEGDVWLGSVGENCDCTYVRYSINLSKILCDAEYLGNSRPYVVVGKKIKFPRGAHRPTLPIIYAASGEDLEDGIEVDDTIGALVSDYLFKRFSGRLPEDRTNNANANK